MGPAMGWSSGLPFLPWCPLLRYLGHILIRRWRRLLESGIALPSVLTTVELMRCGQCDMLK